MAGDNGRARTDGESKARASHRSFAIL